MPLSRQLAFFFVVSWIITVLVLGSLLVTFRLSQAEALLAESEQQLVTQHARELQIRFDEIPKAHAAADELHAFWYDRLSRSEVDARFAAAFVQQSDGTWRSRDVLFEERSDPILGHIGGMAAFIRPGPLDASIKRDLVAALASIIALAPGQRHFLESLWYVSPRGDILIFAPDRKDQLAFYRRSAPASSNFTALPFIQTVMPDRNPAGRTLCTSLSPAVYDATGRTKITSCQTPSPASAGGIGVWGTSLLMNQRLADMVHPGTGARTVALAASDGTLIAGPGLLGREGVAADVLEKVSKDLRWSSIGPALLKMTEPGVIDLPEMPWLITYAKVAGPDWLLVHLRDREAIAQRLSADLPLLALMALLLLVMQVVVVLVFIRRQVSRPLQQMASRYSVDARIAGNVRVNQTLPAEIRALEHQLNTAWTEIAGLVQGLEGRVAERTSELSTALQVAENANKAINAFLANVSHEIRTPLNGVVALSSVLLRSGLSPQQHEMVKIIQASSETLKLVVSDILDASNLEAGKLNLQLDPFDLRTVIEEASQGFAVSAEEKGLRFVIMHDPTLEGSYLGDAHRIRQILGNLASNAVKFTDSGEIRIATRRDENDGAIIIEVTDSGIGFDDGFSERLFGRFERADNALTRRIGGTGLGLSISRALADRMGGSLTARSEPGAGSCFTLRLPLQHAAVSVPAADRTGASLGAMPAGGSGNLRILVAEDHPRNREVMMILLEQIGAVTTCVTDGRGAIERFRSDSFDLVLMDMQMPDLDGLEVTTLIREHEQRLALPRTPIIMITANTTSEHAAQAIAAGCDAHLSKPVTPEALYSMIRVVKDNAAMAGSAVS